MSAIAVYALSVPGHVLLADSRFAAAHAGELPDARASGVEIPVDVGINHARLAALHAFPYGVGEISGAPDAHAGNACRTRHRGEVGVVRLVGAGMLEIGGKLATAEIAALQPADR